MTGASLLILLFVATLISIVYLAVVLRCMARFAALHARVGWILHDEAEWRVRAHLASHPKDLHEAYRYSLETFGLDPGAIAHLFKTYREYFDVREEDAP
jgi:hypothetical protein